MGFRLGVDLGTSFTAATIGRAGSTHGTSMGADSAVVPSVVYIGADGTRLYGKAAAEMAGAEPERVLRGFIRRVGDETPMLPEAGASTAAHRVAADFVAWVVGQATVQEGREPAAVAVTHPATWGPHKRDLLSAALREAGVPGVTLVAEPVAAATVAAEARTFAAGAVVAVYDLGGRTFDASLVRLTEAGTWTSIGRPAGLPDLGGADLDDLVLSHVTANLTPDQQQALAQLDAEDAATAAALSALRTACVQAKEVLSADTVTKIEVQLPGVTGSVRVTRSEFEALAASAVEATIDVLDSVIDSAGLSAADIDCILISGGSSRIPLVTQMLSRQFEVPVVSAGTQSPAIAIATGAVLSLGELPAAPALPVVQVAKQITKQSRKAAKLAMVARAAEAADAAEATEAAQLAAAASVAEAARAAEAARVAEAATVPAPAKRVAPAAPAKETTRKPIAPAVPAPGAKAAPTPTAKAVAPKAPVIKAPAVRTEAPAPAPAESPVAGSTAPATPDAEISLPHPAGPSSKPIRPRRGARRAEVVGLEGLASAGRGTAAPGGAVPVPEAPRAVVAARAVRSVDALLVAEPASARESHLPPPRPAMDDYGFVAIDDEIEALQAGWTWRSVFTVRRTLALGVLTAAIFVGSTAWTPATPAITEQSAPGKVASSAQAQR